MPSSTAAAWALPFGSIPIPSSPVAAACAQRPFGSIQTPWSGTAACVPPFGSTPRPLSPATATAAAPCVPPLGSTLIPLSFATATPAENNATVKTTRRTFISFSFRKFVRQRHFGVCARHTFGTIAFPFIISGASAQPAQENGGAGLTLTAFEDRFHDLVPFRQ